MLIGKERKDLIFAAAEPDKTYALDADARLSILFFASLVSIEAVIVFAALVERNGRSQNRKKTHAKTMHAGVVMMSGVSVVGKRKM